jgi:hypothetical protein
MITGFEVGALFKLVDDVTPGLKRILASIAELNKAIAKTREGLATGFNMPGIAGAIAETDSLAAAWTKVGVEAAAAARVMASSATTARTAAAASVPAAGVGLPGGGRQRLGGFLGGAAHLSGPSVGIPGGSHARLGGTPAMIGAGLAAYGIYEAANMEDAVWQMIYHSGQKNTKENKNRFRKIIEDGMKTTGFDLKDVAAAAIQDIRLMQGTPGGGLEQLPEMIKIAAVEARLKGTSLKESMTSIVEFAHMFKAYTPEAIAKLAPVFAFLSTANPNSLSGMVRSSGYAVPILESSMGIDPVTAALLGTALTRAGITSTKSGTWLRELGTRGLPSGKKKHDEALERLGLIDANGKPTWFTNGKPDIEKAIEIGSAAAAGIPVEERPGVMRNAFGVQGAGALAVLGDPRVSEQTKALRKEMESDEFKNRYGTALEEYGKNSPVQQARTTVQEFNVAMIELGEKTLPMATAALGVFSGAFGFINKYNKPAPEGQGSGWGIIPRAYNYMFPPSPGGDGALKPQKQSYTGGPLRAQPLNFLQQSPTDQTNKPQPASMNFLQGPPTKQHMPQVKMDLNIDGRTLAQAISEVLEELYTHPTGPPEANGWDHFRTQGRQDST